MSSMSTENKPNKALHPTAYSPFVPHSLSAAGELDRWAATKRRDGPYVTTAIETILKEMKMAELKTKPTEQSVE